MTGPSGKHFSRRQASCFSDMLWACTEAMGLTGGGSSQETLLAFRFIGKAGEVFSTWQIAWESLPNTEYKDTKARVGSPHSSWQVISEWAHLQWGPGLLWRASNTVQLSPPPAATISLHQVNCGVSLLLTLHLPLGCCDQSAYRSQCACVSVREGTLTCIWACGLVHVYLWVCMHLFASVHVYMFTYICGICTCMFVYTWVIRGQP